MADIELRVFKYFVMLAEERHFARAAERLGITPSTLTHQIQALEARLGVTLCRRKPNTRVELTDIGVRFLEQARQVLRQAEEAQRVARQAARGEIGRIEIGHMLSASFAGYIQEFVGAFRRANPAIEILLRRQETLGQLNAIVGGQLDVGFTRPMRQYPPELGGFIVYEQPLIVALPSDHPLARRKRIPPAALRGEKFITASLELDIGFPIYTELVTVLAGFKPNVTIRAPDIASVLTYVSAGYGIGVVPQCLNRLRLPNVAYRELQVASPLLSPIACVYRRNESAPAIQAFIQVMHDHKLRD
jgi:DNA-binding transcriptional LysR family regulator